MIAQTTIDRRWVATVAVCAVAAAAQGASPKRTLAEKVGQVLAETRPVTGSTEGRWPVIVWPLQGFGTETDDELRRIVRELDARGLVPVGRWTRTNAEKTLPAALRLARIQKEAGTRVVINTTGVMERFFNGDESTAHIAEDGSPFFDESFSPRVKIGCPFAVRQRYDEIRGQVEQYAPVYREAGLAPDLAIADWEIDGPIEWNGAWDHCRRCVRCRRELPGIENFAVFQSALRRIRCDMQRACYAEPMKAAFPGVLVGNYAVYPHDGYRYWYDYFEEDAPEPVPCRVDGGARYRPWFHEFPLTGYNVAVGVVYTWHRTFEWYDFADADYRWFYNLLLVASNAGRNTPSETPLISFVHWHTTAPPEPPDPAVRQMSAGAYQELLWHMLLRGHDGFALWCMPDEIGIETSLVQEVFAASLAYNDFIIQGEPVSFDVPRQPGTVVSGLRLGDRVLVRRTDFGGASGEAVLEVDGKRFVVPPGTGECRVVRLRE